MSARQVVLGVVLGAVALAALAAGLVLFLFRPLKAEPVALDALKGLRTREAPYGLEVLPQAPKALLAFYPGARVEPLAYAPVLAPLVGNGYLVVLLRVPQGIALLGQDRALEAGRPHPGLPSVVGGHSLGGVVAAGVAARRRRAAWPRTAARQTRSQTRARTGPFPGRCRRPRGAGPGQSPARTAAGW